MAEGKISGTSLHACPFTKQRLSYFYTRISLMGYVTSSPKSFPPPLGMGQTETVETLTVVITGKKGNYPAKSKLSRLGMQLDTL